MTEQLKAEAYVREQRPALMELTFGCEVKPFNNLKRFHKGYFVTYDGKTLLHYENEKTGKSECSIGDLTIIGHPIQLQDWLAVLNNMLYIVDGMGNLYLLKMMMNWEVPKIVGQPLLKFNLTTGQPATEADYKAFNDIVNV